MQIIVTRYFISTRLGNVEKGTVLDIDDAYAKHLLVNGLAEVISARPVQEEAKAGASSFPQPVKADPHGSSSPADQASQPATASLSGAGKKPVTFRKPKPRG